MLFADVYGSLAMPVLVSATKEIPTRSMKHICVSLLCLFRCSRERDDLEITCFTPTYGLHSIASVLLLFSFLLHRIFASKNIQRHRIHLDSSCVWFCLLKHIIKRLESRLKSVKTLDVRKQEKKKTK